MALLDPGSEEEDLQLGPSDGDGSVPLECPESPGLRMMQSQACLHWEGQRLDRELPAGEDQLQRAGGDDRLQISSNEDPLPPMPNQQVWSERSHKG